MKQRPDWSCDCSHLQPLPPPKKINPVAFEIYKLYKIKQQQPPPPPQPPPPGLSLWLYRTKTHSLRGRAVVFFSGRRSPVSSLTWTRCPDETLTGGNQWHGTWIWTNSKPRLPEFEGVPLVLLENRAPYIWYINGVVYQHSYWAACLLCVVS